MKAAILAAGRGTRMRGLCSVTPKPMLPLANRPILSLIFSRLKQMGVDEVALVIGFEGNKLEQLIGDGHQYGMDVTYIWQTEQLGTAHAALLCEEFVAGEPFVLIFGDILTRNDNYAAMAEQFRRDDVEAVLTVFPVEDASNGAAVDIEDGWVRRIVEKPPPGTIPNAYNNAGIFIWPADVFDLIRDLELSPRGEYEFTDGIVRFLEQGRPLAAFELLGYWENITDPETCIRMNHNLLLEVLPPGADLADPQAKVAGSAYITQCRLAAGAVVGEGCKLDGSTLDENCRLGDNVSARCAEIGPGAAIGEGCRLGSHVSIGEGAVIAPGCTIGPNASVGPGCVIGEGSTITSTIVLDGSTVGAGSSLTHAMLGYRVEIEAGRTLSGTPEEAVEVLNE